MQYMTFPASCAYCGVANLLEPFGIEISDRELALRAKLPYLLEYDRESDAFLAGAGGLQSPRHFDLALNPIGFAFVEETVEKDAAPDLLDAHVPSMIGVMGEFGQHAMVYVGREEGTYRFFNPHRAGDGQQDFLLWTREELLSRLSGEKHVGFLMRTEPQKPDVQPLIAASRETLMQYHTALRNFLQEHRSKEELMNRRDPLLRPIALDWPVMMELAGEETLLEKIRRFQGQVFDLFQTDGCVPAERLDMELLEEIFTDYGMLLQRE